MTKMYCSRECLMSDWNTIHKELCRTDEEEQKKKTSKAERVAKGVGSENLWYNALLETPQMGRQAVEAVVNIFSGTRI